MLNSSVLDRYRVDADPDVNLNSDADTDCHQNDADPQHCYLPYHIGKKNYFIHSSANFFRSQKWQRCDDFKYF